MSKNQIQNISDNLSLKSFLKNLVADAFNIDNRIIKTLAVLFKKPGYLTFEYFNDPDKKYVQPLRLYFIINFIFFLVVPILNTPQFQIFNFSLRSLTVSNTLYRKITESEIRSEQVPEKIYEERFNANLKYNQPAFLFLIIPFFALILNLVNFRNKKYFVEHLIFSIHFLSFILITMFISISLFRLLKFGLSYFSITSGVIGLIIILAMAICILIYLFASIKKFYKNKILASVIKSFILFAGFVFALTIYVQFLFFYTVLALMLGY